MGTISAAFHVMSQALNADQAALDVVANNVANANTTGYTRQTPNFSENDPVTIGGMAYGAGVSAAGATSVRDRVLEARLNQQQQMASASGTRLAALNLMQALFTPETGTSNSAAGSIGNDITSFFSSFSSLEANPTDNALREQVLSTAGALAGDVSNAAVSLQAQQASLDEEAAGVAGQVNALTSAIAKLNVQIQSMAPGTDAGTLEDQRQQELSQLSQLIGVNQVTTENNGLSVTTAAGQLLVSEGSSVPLTTGVVNGVTNFYVGTANVTAALRDGGGSLGGYLTARDMDIPTVLQALDQLAYGISTQVNALNNAGTDMAGDSVNAGDIFAAPAQAAGSAKAMSVVMTDPSHIAAAASGQGTGDNSNATGMANLASAGIVNGQTPTNFYSNFVTALGATVLAVQTENTAQSASVTQLQTQRSALSSVNLNDEASSLTLMERSYQAASQVFAILNTLMASALNMGVQTSVS